MIQQASTKGIQKNDIYTTFIRYLHFRQDHKLQFFMGWTIYNHLEGYKIIYNKHLFYKDHSQQHLALTLSLFGFWLPLLALWFPSTGFSRSTLNNSIEHLENVLPFFVQPLVLFIVTFHIQWSLSCFIHVSPCHFLTICNQSKLNTLAKHQLQIDTFLETLILSPWRDKLL